MFPFLSSFIDCSESCEGLLEMISRLTLCSLSGAWCEFSVEFDLIRYKSDRVSQLKAGENAEGFERGGGR